MTSDIEARRSAVRKAYERGVPVIEISRLFDVHRGAVWKWAKREGWRTPKSRLLVAQSAQLRRQQRQNRADARVRAQISKRHRADWQLIRLLLQRSIDNHSAEDALVAHRCAETLKVLQTAETEHAIAPTAVAARKSQPKLRTRTTDVQATASFDDLFDGWVRSTPGLRDQTRRRWRVILDKLALFLGHSNPAAVTVEDAVRWKDHLLAVGHDPRTVRSNFIGAASAIFSNAEGRQSITYNPFRGIKIPHPRSIRARSKGLTNEEAQHILRSALQLQPLGLKAESHNTDFCRWSPWVCAFTGARIAEVAQLRRIDLLQRDGIWCINFTPDAGSIKTNRARMVPIHPQLIELGFLQFVDGLARPLLFMRSANNETRSRSKIVGRWVRGIGISDQNVSPNHGWRHRFKTLCRAVGIPHEYHNAITGHTNSAVVGNVYGEYPLSALYREICKLPRVSLSD